MYKDYLISLLDGAKEAVANGDAKAYREFTDKASFVAGVHFGHLAIEEYLAKENETETA